MDNYYTGIGSRKTPVNILWQMYFLARMLADSGWILRSGGAPGADTAFERGVQSQEHGDMDIFLPWDGFNGRKEEVIHRFLDSTESVTRIYTVPPYNDSLVRLYHSGFRMLSDPERKLMSRNSYQVLGGDLKTPSQVVFCYTMDGKASGGTGQAIRIARDNKIPVINLHNPNALQKYMEEHTEIFSTGSYSKLLQQVNNANK